MEVLLSRVTGEGFIPREQFSCSRESVAHLGQLCESDREGDNWRLCKDKNSEKLRVLTV